MHAFFSFCQWLDATWVGQAMKGGDQYAWLFPVIESLHIIGVVLLVTATSIIDLRMLGLAFREDRISKLSGQFMPWAWTGFVAQLVTGFFLFSAEAVRCYFDPAFWIKMGLILIAMINVVVFHETISRRMASWDEARFAPLTARAYAVFSILLWFAITGVGRWLNSSAQNYGPHGLIGS